MEIEDEDYYLEKFAFLSHCGNGASFWCKDSQENGYIKWEDICRKIHYLMRVLILYA